MKNFDSISSVLDRSICAGGDVYDGFKQRLGQGLLTQEENPLSHFCVYFLPYNPENKKVFIVHHKKSGLWISPGGHMDKGETVWETANREINEELGVKSFFKETPPPFLLTITPIDSQAYACKLHFDIWCLVQTDGKDFDIDGQEFFDTKWLTIGEARQVVTNSQNIMALDLVEKM